MREFTEEEKKMLAALDARTDEEIERAAMEDPDALLLTKEQAASSVRLYDFPGKTVNERIHNALMMKNKKQISLRLDTDVLSYFRGKGKGYQTYINAVLRAAMEMEKAERQKLSV